MEYFRHVKSSLCLQKLCLLLLQQFLQTNVRKGIDVEEVRTAELIIDVLQYGTNLWQEVYLQNLQITLDLGHFRWGICCLLIQTVQQVLMLLENVEDKCDGPASELTALSKYLSQQQLDEAADQAEGDL